MVESKNFRIENGELKFLRAGHLPVKWGDIIIYDEGAMGCKYAYEPIPFRSEDDPNNSTGIMTSERCAEIASLLEQLDSAGKVTQ